MFSITSFFCFCYIAFAYLGSILLNVVKFEAEDYLGMYQRSDIFLDVWIFTSLGLMLLIIGFACANIVFRTIDFPNKYSEMLKKPVVVSVIKIKRSFFFVVILFLVSILALLLYRNAIGGLPLESVFSAYNGRELALLRSDATNNFSGKVYRYVMFMEFLPLFLFILVSFIKQLKERKWTYLYILLLLYNVIYTLSTLQKAPVLKFLLLCCIIYFFKKGFVSKKILIGLISVSVLLVFAMYILFMGLSDASSSTILDGALHRIFIGAIHPFYWYIKYAEEFGFLYGTSFPNPAGIFPFENFRLTVEIMNYAKGDLLGDLVGSMPTVFIAELYVNFGVIGMVLGGILFGFLLQSLDIVIVTYMLRSKTVLASSLYVFLVYYFSEFAETGISGIIVDANLYLVLLIAFCYYITTNYKFLIINEKSANMSCNKCSSSI